MNRGIDLLLPGAEPVAARWPGGGGLMALQGAPGDAAFQLRWQPHVDAQPVPIGTPMTRAGQLSDPFDLPRGLLTVAVIGGGSDTFAGATVYPIPKTFI